MTHVYRPTEHEEQVKVFQWAQYQRNTYPDLNWLFAIPNGAKLPYTKVGKKRVSRQAMWLLKEGLKPGVSDMCLPVARGGYHGMWIELKRDEKAKATDKQTRFIKAMKDRGYYARVCHGGDQAIEVIEWYLQQEETKVC